MKKWFFLSAVLAAGLAVTSCSSDDKLGETGPITPETGGEDYMSINISLPTDLSTRADDDVYAQGKANEYAVKEATLYLFKGTFTGDPLASTYLAHYNLKDKLPSSWDDLADGKPLTATAEIVQAISKEFKPVVSQSGGTPTYTTKLYAYVVLNMTPAELEALVGANLADKTFTEIFSSKTLSSSIDISKGLVMTNAPLASAAGGVNNPSSATVSVLAEIDPEQIYDTEAKATNHPAASVYVERNVAKVTVEGTDAEVKPATGSGTFVDAEGNPVKYKLQSWVLDNTTQSTYFQRKVDKFAAWKALESSLNTSNHYRFVGDVNNDNRYRVHWGESVNYDASATLKQETNNANVTGTLGVDNPQYCYENTFETKYMDEKYTTRAVVKAQLNEGKDFYTINGAYYGKADGSADVLKARILNILASDADIKAALTFEPTEVEVTTISTTEPSQVKVTGVTLKNGTNTYAVADAKLTALFNGASPSHLIQYFAGGIAYYRVLIRHFNEDQTPWNSESHLTTNNPYYDTGDTAENDANYLGRYGVLRNNWYTITVGEVRGFGSPSIPTVPTSTGTWDDKVNTYIACDIRILSWALREQTATLE